MLRRKLFDFCWSVRPESQTCTNESFGEVINSEQVLRICNQIRQLVELSDAKDQIQKLKAQLPGFCFHAHFTDGKRSNQSAEASGLVSLDLDHIDDPKSFFEGLEENAKANRLALAFITPSTHGLKLVFEVPKGAMTLEEAQEILSDRLGTDAYFDSVTHDASRLAFAVPASYILYRDDAILFGEHELDDDFGTEQQYMEKTIRNGSEEYSNEPVPENEADKHFVDGFSMKEIIEHITKKVCGETEPKENRNNTLYQVVKIVRVGCDDNNELVMKVMPQFGQQPMEWRKTIGSAMSRPISVSARKEFETAITELKRARAIENGDNTWKLPQLPSVLPPLFKEIAHVMPVEYRPAQMAACCAIGGFFGTMMKANFSDPDEQEEWHTPSFMVVVTGAFASGKKTITQTYNLLTERQRKLEEPVYDLINKYNRNKSKENMPPIPIRLMPEKLSMTSLSVHMENAKGRHLFLHTPEIDTLKTSNGSGSWNDLSTVFRKAHDNDRFGQLYMSSESHCTDVEVFLNMLIQAQPETMESFFNEKNVLNGLVSRVIFCDMPDTLGQRRAKVKKLSAFEMKNINHCIDLLEKMGVVKEEAEYDDEGNLVKEAVMERQVIQIPRVRKALRELQQKHQDHYVLTQENPAEDIFSRRAAAIGFRAGMVAYVTSGMKETKAVIDFAVWVAEYTLQSLLLHFGDVFNRNYHKRQETHTDKVIAINRVSNFSLYDAIPSEFTVEDIQKARRNNGLSELHNPWKTTKMWVEKGWTERVWTDGKKKVWRKKREGGEYGNTDSKVA